ncbi:hypothetical protein CXB35_22620 [Pseudomonas syringae]|nr:hypothetical protein CXB35_22620 [Pseudomonas syringae]
MAQVLELLGDKKVSLVKQVYFYLDDEFGCLELKDSHVKHYIKTSEMYHPLSNFLLADTDIDERIVIEFEVLG